MRQGSDWNLSAALKDLEEHSDARRRGPLFEQLVADLFRANRFDVRLDPGTAQPRQTDLIATRGSDRYLIECKWRSKKADINDIGSLRDRLRRTTGATGLIVSKMGFSQTATSEVSIHREQPILLMSASELRKLAGPGPDGLLDLLWQKREALLVDGEAIVDEPTRRRRKAKRRTLPDSPVRFVIGEDEPTPVMSFGGDFGQIAFAHELEDIDWVPAAGTGVTLDVPVPVMSEAGILDLLSKLADLGWASPDASWSIQQRRTVWHGFGAAAFADTLPRWAERAAADESHHSEEFCYVDNCAGGFYSLTSNVSAHETRWAQATVLSFQLQGIPLDPSPLLQLCRSIGVHSEIYFRPRGEKSISRTSVPEWMREIGRPHALLTTPDQLLGRQFVSGLVIRNPLKDGRWREDPQRRLDSGLYGLEELEFLICSLSDFHLADDGRSYSYTLERIEVARTSEGSLFRPVARWESAHDGGVDTPGDEDTEPDSGGYFST